ncbi:hypothetical protein J6590_098821 [Homalodisca vitripennis]|nr:hypothetical protein J6590_098821 [Homalodisca vitripennis]
MNEVTNPETPQAKKEGIPPSKSPLRAAFGLQMLRQQHEDTSEEEDLSLNKMKAILKEMAKALLTQRNVNKAIKDGIPKLESHRAAALIPSTPLNSQGPAPQTPLGNWERRLSKKER